MEKYLDMTETNVTDLVDWVHSMAMYSKQLYVLSKDMGKDKALMHNNESPDYLVWEDANARIEAIEHIFGSLNEVLCNTQKFIFQRAQADMED